MGAKEEKRIKRKVEAWEKCVGQRGQNDENFACASIPSLFLSVCCYTTLRIHFKFYYTLLPCTSTKPTFLLKYFLFDLMHS